MKEKQNRRSRNIGGDKISEEKKYQRKTKSEEKKYQRRRNIGGEEISEEKTDEMAKLK